MTPRGVGRGARGSRFRSFLSSVSIEFPDPEKGPARGHVGGTDKTTIVGLFRGRPHRARSSHRLDAEIPLARPSPGFVQILSEGLVTFEVVAGAGRLREEAARDGDHPVPPRLPLSL